MSKLYASISADASKTDATRRGHRSISSHTRGWHVGAKVCADVLEDGRVRILVYKTGGSSGYSDETLIAEFSDAE